MRRTMILAAAMLLIWALGVTQAYAKPCPGCGAENQEIAKFCKECGFDFSKAGKAPGKPSDPMEILRRARVAYEGRMWGEALGLYQRLEKLRPGNPEAKDRIKECEGEVREEQRRLEETAKAELERRQYEAWVAKARKERGLVLEEAKYLSGKGDHAGASKKALMTLAGSWDWEQGRGVLRQTMARGKASKCCDAAGAFGDVEVSKAYRMELGKKAIEVCAEVALELASESQSRGDETKACALFRQVVKWKPGDVRAEAGMTGCPPEAGDAKVFSLVAGKQLRMHWIPAGGFQMGSPSSESKRSSGEGRHRVTLSRGFWMGKYEVTQEQYEAVVGSNPSYFKGGKRPVEKVSWNDAVEFCNKLSDREGLRRCYSGSGESIRCDFNANGYRLPTEAEWEYACRAGTTSSFHTGECLSTSEANYNGDYPYTGCSKGRDRGKTWDVGSGKANGWGLYDMHGNVWEWCWDRDGDYPTGSTTDPTGSSGGSLRVSRGGCWSNPARYCRSAYRRRLAPGLRYDLGFRLLRKE